ncbi:MAG: gluconate 2-dehydrogenase subunit 3 family protein [Pseudomonadota bacterium]
MSQPDKNRRRVLLALGATAGVAGAAELAGLDRIVAVASSFKPNADSGPDGHVLSASQLAVLRAVCDQVIPATETPGAVDVDVHGFVDHQLRHCHTDDEQRAAVALIERLDAASHERQQTTFVQLGNAEQLALLEDLEAGRGGFSGTDRAHFKGLKSLIVFGYFTSEVGATRALRFMPYPGGFKGSVPYEPGTPAWFR